MPGMTALNRVSRKKRLASFTLIELLVVMAIILILASLVLYAGFGVMKIAGHKRAMAEIQAMTTALESYKADNGTYPLDNNLTTAAYTANDGSQSGGVYQLSSQDLFTNLTGQAYFNATPTAKTYMSFKINQVGTNSLVPVYVKDPWNNSYGYSTGTAANVPYCGTNLFDLWSTGGVTQGQVTANASLTNAWISNWQY
jgi:prepilin-type N-terminal cleavage/methylation domain-containing protein